MRNIVLILTFVIFPFLSNLGQDKKTIVFFGNSLTAGLGVSPEKAFPAIIQQRINEAGYDYHVVNAGLSGETTAGGVNRVDWILKNNDVNIFVLELGANDGLRGLNIEQTKKNLQKIIEKVRSEEPGVKIVLAGMQVPPNMGDAYTNEFKNIFPDIAEQYNVKLIRFLLEGVAGNKQLNQADGIHPNAEGYKKVAENVWEVLKPML